MRNIQDRATNNTKKSKQSTMATGNRRKSSHNSDSLLLFVQCVVTLCIFCVQTKNFLVLYSNPVAFKIVVIRPLCIASMKFLYCFYDSSFFQKHYVQNIFSFFHMIPYIVEPMYNTYIKCIAVMGTTMVIERR